MLLPVLLLACSSGGGPSRQAPEPQGDSFLSRESGSQDSLPQTFDGELRGIWVTRWTYDNADDLINSGEIDALMICTPHFQHTTLGIQGLEAGLLNSSPPQPAVAPQPEARGASGQEDSESDDSLIE